MSNDTFQISKHICPRNCYGSCGIIAYSDEGRLVKVEGDPNHSVTQGKLCPKAYGYVQQVYDEDRLRYPMRQLERGSGEWQRISWEEAINTITDQIVSLYEKFGTNEYLCLNKYSGNFGVVHNSVEQFFDGLGDTTRVVGSPCWSAGLDAHTYDFGNYYTSDPSEMSDAKVIILWGVNPAWTAPHTLPYIFKAREKGAKIIVIDPIFTKTAEKADEYIQVRPGADGALAIAIAKVIVERGFYDIDFTDNSSVGFDEFKAYLSSMEISDLLEECDVSKEVIAELAELVSLEGPVFIWQGFGLQRHTNGGQNIRAINALMALTGNIGKKGSGAHFAHQATWAFNIHKNEKGNYRSIPVHRFAEEVLKLNDPPVKMLWVAARNFLAQDTKTEKIIEAMKNIEMIVVVDTVLTETAKYADIVLPTTTFFEEEDVVASYWHHIVGINDKAIDAFYESKSDFTIAKMLSAALNKRIPKFSQFPEDISIEAYIENEFNDDLYEMLNINHWTDLIGNPKRADINRTSWKGRVFETPSRKFEFYSERAKQNNHPPMASFEKGLKPSEDYPFWLLTPHTLYSLNSQLYNKEFSETEDMETVAYVSSRVAKERKIGEDHLIKVYNDNGKIQCRMKVNETLPGDIIVLSQGSSLHQRGKVNQLIPGFETDMGCESTGANGIAFNDVFVNFSKM
ncbi:molybdopterin-dependent oxidoreductase [Bacillaceae bacterium IKA-2]|nr:molybdopterin-dependent oxidoreductase [Bacillaceae bacterium IKA-2]